jgi:hypothetical protein
MQQALIDIRTKAIKVAQKAGDTAPYLIPCSTLLAILRELERLEKLEPVSPPMSEAG